jgi:hypothetical protein
MQRIRVDNGQVKEETGRLAKDSIKRRAVGKGWDGQDEQDG